MTDTEGMIFVAVVMILLAAAVLVMCREEFKQLQTGRN
jgi:hypothetical protein